MNGFLLMNCLFRRSL